MLQFGNAEIGLRTTDLNSNRVLELADKGRARFGLVTYAGDDVLKHLLPLLATAGPDPADEVEAGRLGSGMGFS